MFLSVKNCPATLLPHAMRNDEAFRLGRQRAGKTISRHNLNASDALFLRQALDWLAQLPEDDQVVVIAGDRRLLRAAEVERLAGLDPEQSDPSDVKTLLTTV